LIELAGRRTLELIRGAAAVLHGGNRKLSDLEGFSGFVLVHGGKVG
jgi:hypothetical protein